MKNLLKSLYVRNNAPPSLPGIFIAGLLIFSGCAPVASQNTRAEQKAANLEAPGDIDASEPLASDNQQQPSSFAEHYNRQRLQQIEALIHSGDNTAAQSRADAINPLDLPVEQQAQLNLLHAQIFLGIGDAEMATKWLAVIMPEQLDLPHKIEYFQSLAFAFSLTGKPLESAKSRIALNTLLTEPKQRDENQSAILESLALVPDAELEQGSPPSATDPLTGWLAMAKILKVKDRPDFSEQIAQWREKFPGHPANAAFLENVQEAPKPMSNPPSSIALLLPGSGPFAQAGNAIRTGFMAAYNAQNSNSGKPEIRFYDTGQAAALFLYNQAVNDGAGIIVGPLEKENIQSLAGPQTLQTPVLALNHVPGLEKNNLYQFGLSPIDDIEEITRKAWSDGHRKAVLLIPDNAQGQRIAGFFTGTWQDLGGAIVESQTYNPKETDFSGPIKKLLNLDESEHRFDKIRELIPELKYTPRRRHDADVLLLNANSSEARLINPQLHYYQAHGLPVYATPGVYSGQVNPAPDADLDTVVFCDAPWLLDKTYMGALSMESLHDSWQSLSGAYLRLFAMGMDAYRMTSRLQKQDFSAYGGATGELSLVADNRIKRHLACAKFTDGRPELTDPIQSTAEPFQIDIQEPALPPIQEQPVNDHVIE